MLIFLNKFRGQPTRVIVGVLVCVVCPALSLAVNIGGQVGLTDKANNQPTLRVQITGTLKPGLTIGGFDYERWRTGAWITWKDSDLNPPPYTETDGTGNFQLQVGNFMNSLGNKGGMTRVDPPLGLLKESPQSNGSNGHQIETDLGLDPSLGVGIKYQFSAGYDGFLSQQYIEPEDMWKEKYSLGAGLTINNFTSYIDWWKPGLDIQQAGTTFENNTGHSVTGWEKYFGDGEINNSLNTAWPVQGEIRNNFNWGENVKDYWLGSENNAVNFMAPAQGLYPHTWAKAEDPSPVATLYMKRNPHE